MSPDEPDHPSEEFSDAFKKVVDRLSEIDEALGKVERLESGDPKELRKLEKLRHEREELGRWLGGLSLKAMEAKGEDERDYYEVQSEEPGERPRPLPDEKLDLICRKSVWTIEEALFTMQGLETPPALSRLDVVHHYLGFDAQYELVRSSIEAGELCRRARVKGKMKFVATPVEWLEWAERKGIAVNDRVRSYLKADSEDPVQRTKRAIEVRQQKASERRDVVKNLIDEIYKRGEEEGAPWACETEPDGRRKPLPFKKEDVYHIYMKRHPEFPPIKFETFKRHVMSGIARFQNRVRKGSDRRLRDLLRR